MLRERQAVFARTGGVHAAGLFDADGTCSSCARTSGRHNAVDKVTGARVLAGDSPAAACLVVSGRAGFELVQKAAAAGSARWSRRRARPASRPGWRGRAASVLYGFTSARRCVRYT